MAFGMTTKHIHTTRHVLCHLYKEDFIMSKKLVVIAGIVGLAAIAAAAVAFFLTRNKAICEVLEEDDDEI